MACIHESPVQEYTLITDQFEDQEDLIFYDGPLIGTAVCTTCGDSFVYVRVDSTLAGREWLYFPITMDIERKLLDGSIDPSDYVKARFQDAHMRMVEVTHGNGPCRVEWIRPANKAVDTL